MVRTAFADCGKELQANKNECFGIVQGWVSKAKGKIEVKQLKRVKARPSKGNGKCRLDRFVTKNPSSLR